jgi:GH25 family lysozyme M1 (1,4-beta-N-acetylmuramidase)
MTKNIIDISHWNDRLDWNYIDQTKNGPANSRIDGVIAKATQGLNLVDPLFAENQQGAASIGMPFGIYHFLSYTLKEYQKGYEIQHGINQADFFHSVVKGNPGQLPISIDQESNDAVAGDFAWEKITIFNVGRVLKISLSCFTRMHELFGRYPQMYTPGWIAAYMKNFTDGGYWGARYKNYTPLERFLTYEELIKGKHKLPELGAYSEIDLWQYSSKGIGKKFGGKYSWVDMDLNIFLGDDTKFSKWCGNNCVPTIPILEEEPVIIPALEDYKYAVVVSRDGMLNIREQVGTASKIVAHAPFGDKLDILGWHTDSNGNRWIDCGYKQFACVNYNGVKLLDLLKV